MNKFLLILFFFFSFSAFAQQSKIDSLQNLLSTAKNDTTKINALNALSGELINTGDYEKAMQHAKEALALCDQFLSSLRTPNSQLLTKKAAAYNNIGAIHKEKGDYDKALEFFFKSLKIKEEIGDKKEMAASYNNIGLIHKKKGDYDMALEFHFKSLKIREEIGDKNGMAYSYNNIGLIHKEKGDYDKALEFFFKSLKIQEEIGDKKGMAASYNNIGLIHRNKGDYDKTLEFYFKSLKIKEEIGNKKGMASSYGNIGAIHDYKGDYDKALEFYFKGLKIFEEIGDKNGMAYSYNNIGGIHKVKGDHDKALEFYFKSLKIKEEIGEKKGMASSYSNIGMLYTSQKNFSEAREYLNKGLALSKAIGAKDYTKESYGGLSKLDSTLGNWKAAYEYHKLYSEVKDSIFNEESAEKTADMQARYESEKKEAQIKLMEKDKEKQAAVSATESKKQRIIIWSVLGGLVLIGIILIVVFRSLRITRKQKHIIELQKDEVTKQREEIAHKNKDLTDSINYAQRIQSAILTSEQYLNDMFLPQGQVSSHFILYKPKDIVAGDFYWAYKTPDEKAIWVAADCTGHGVPGAFMSMIGNSLLNEIVVEKGIHEPDEILNNLRAGVIKSLGQSGGDKKKDGMDAAMCCWDKTTNKISFSGANNSLWIFRKGEFIEIPSDSQPVGQHLVMNPFTKREFQLQHGDTLYTFTDGYCDQFGGQKGKKFKYKPFRELLISIQDKSMPEQKQILDKTIDDWRGEMEQIDDICVFGVRV